MLSRKLNKNLTLFLLLCSFFACPSDTLSVKLRQVRKPNHSPFTNFLQDIVNLTLTNTQNIQYTGKISIGSKNQPFNLIFDTASPWLWVLPSSQNASQYKNLFNCSDSVSCRYKKLGTGHYDIGKYFMFSSNENVQGYIAWDNIAFDDNQSHFNQSFLILQNDNTDLIGGDSVDGICGLGPKNDKNLSTILDQLLASGQINQRMFSLYLDDNPEAYEEDNSEILFGGIDSASYIGAFVSVHAMDAPYWQTVLNSSYLSIGSNSVTVRLGASIAAFDSGSDIIKMTPDDFSSFTYDLKAQFGLNCSRNIYRQYACSCPNGDLSIFPNITLVLDSQVFTVQPSMYVNVRSDSCVLLIDGCLTGTSILYQNTNMEPGMPSPNPDPSDYVVLGSPFLRTYYSVFNADNKTVSFAAAVHNTKTVISSLEMIYMAFGIFIMVMFVVLIVWVLKICTSKGEGKDKRIFDSLTADKTEALYHMAPSKS